MRARPGRYVGYKDIEITAFVVDLPAATNYEEHQERTRFIRDNCRRADWSNVATQYSVTPLARYMFVDQEDAMHFKMRFA